MLAQITPKQFTEWVAAYAIGLDVEGWAQSSTVATAVQNELAKILAALQHRTVSVNDFRNPWDYLPSKYREIIRPEDDQPSTEVLGEKLKAAAHHGNNRKPNR